MEFSAVRRARTIRAWAPDRGAGRSDRDEEAGSLRGRADRCRVAGNSSRRASTEVLRQHGTEMRGSSPLNKEKRTGEFLCAGCGQPLFSSDTKYESGTGWPSFYAPLEGAVATEDGSRALHDAHRGPLQPLRRAPRARVRRRPGADRSALLHERRRHEVRARRRDKYRVATDRRRRHHVDLQPVQDADADRTEALKGREVAMPVPDRHAVNGHPLAAAVSRRVSSRPCSAWAASGAPSGSSGSCPACTPPPSATPAATRRTRRTRKSAPAEPVTPKWCSSCSIRRSVSYDELLRDVLGEPRSDAGHAAGQRRRHAVPLGDLRVLRRRSAQSGRAQQGRYEARSRRARLSARSPPRSPTRRRSTTPRSTTSSTSPRIPAATAASAARASPADEDPSEGASTARQLGTGRLRPAANGSLIERIPLSRRVVHATSLKVAALVALVVGTVSSPVARPAAPSAGPALQSIGPLAFGPDGDAVRRRSDGRHDLRDQSRRAGVRRPAGTADVAGIDREDCGDARHRRRRDPHRPTSPCIRRRRTRSWPSCADRAPTRSPRSCASTAPARSSSSRSTRATFTSVALPNPAAVNTTGRGGRAQSVTDLAFSNGRAVRLRPVERGVRVEALVGRRIRSRRPTTARASRSSTAITAGSRRGRRSWRSCR